MSAYSDRIIADGASHYWRLGEPAGGVALDIIGGATGVISGGVTLNQPGALSDGDPAMAFNGTTGQIAAVIPVSFVTPFTVEAWVKTQGSTGAGILTVPFVPGAGSALQLSNYTAARIAVLRADQSAQDICDGQVVITHNLWHHVVIVLPGGNTIRCYVNGVQDTLSAQLSQAWSSTPRLLELGFSSWAGNHWAGSLDDVAIYPRALSAAEIAEHYALRLPPEPPEPPEQTNNNHDGSNLDAAVVELLTSDPELIALLPDGVFIDDAPPGAQRFAIVSLTAPTVDSHTLDGGGFEVVSYLVTANGVSSAIGGPQIKAAADRIDAVLHDAAPVVEGFPAVSIARTGRVRPPLELDPDDRSIRWYRRGGTYELFASK